MYILQRCHGLARGARHADREMASANSPDMNPYGIAEPPSLRLSTMHAPVHTVEEPRVLALPLRMY